MTYAVSTSTITGESGVQEKIVVVQDINENNTVSNDQPTAIAIDYTGYLARIATALESIVRKIANVESHLNVNQQTIALTGVLGDFLENELVTGSVVGRVVSKIGETLIVDNVESILNSGTVTGVSSETTSNYTSFSNNKNLAQSIKQLSKQYTMARLYISDTTPTNDSITINSTNNNSGNYSATLSESGTFSITSNNSAFQGLWLVESLSSFPLAADITIDKIALSREGISGNGTNNITWQTAYGDAGTYYVVRESDNRLVATINISSSRWIPDEKVTGSVNGNGHLEDYVQQSELGKRYIDVVNINDDFTIGEAITGTMSGQTSTIIDIIYINHSRESYNSTGKLAQAGLYKLYIDEGQILKVDNNVSAEQKSEAIKLLKSTAAAAGRL